MISDYKDLTPVQMRHLIREGKFTEPTSGLCPGYAQANLIILRKEHAYDFLLFAQRNRRPALCWKFSIQAAASLNLWQKIVI